MLSKTFMLFSGEDTDNEHSDDIGKDKAKPEPQKQIGKSPEEALKKAQEGQKKTEPPKSSPSDLEKRATAIYFLCTGNKEGQKKWSQDEYKRFLQGEVESGNISTAYGKKWTEQDIAYLEEALSVYRQIIWVFSSL
jgi:hypothetical protein